jgi:endoglucanase
MYYWGVNGVLARTATNLFVANQLEPDPAYLDAAALQVDHLFGRNPFGRTMVTGLGYLPANAPHHRPSQGDGNVDAWPGLLVGGPNSQSEQAKAESAPPGLAWYDSAEDYYVNEIAINWNTALAYALAGFFE